MKNRILIPLLVALIVPGFSFAAKGKKNKKSAPPTAATLAEPLKTHDANGNGKIDSDEAAAVKKAFGENPKGPLAALDKNSNGQLEDAEITPASSTASAASGEKPGRILKKADKNRNQKIDPKKSLRCKKTLMPIPAARFQRSTVTATRSWTTRKSPRSTSAWARRAKAKRVPRQPRHLPRLHRVQLQLAAVRCHPPNHRVLQRLRKR